MKIIPGLRIASALAAALIGFWLPLRLLNFLPQFELEILFDILISFVSGTHIYFYFSKPRRNWRQSNSWISLSLWLDFLCLIPVSLITLVFFDTSLTPWLFLNLLAVRHINDIRSLLDNYSQLRPIFYRIIPLVVLIPLLVHLIACAWIGLGSGSAKLTGDMIYDYVRAIHWTFTTITTVGYGDITPVTIPQMIFTSITQVVGIGFFGFVISNMAAFIARKDAAREQHVYNLEKIENFMVSHRVPNEMQHKVRSYYQYMWNNKKGYQDKSIVRLLPRKMQAELFSHINRPVIEKVPFLADAGADLIEDLMHDLEPRFCVPDEKVFKIGDEGDAMYFIYKGKIEILSESRELIATLNEGDFFGEKALLDDRKRTATARAAEFCEIYVLRKETFFTVCQHYPEFLAHVNEVKSKRN